LGRQRQDAGAALGTNPRPLPSRAPVDKGKPVEKRGRKAFETTAKGALPPTPPRLCRSGCPQRPSPRAARFVFRKEIEKGDRDHESKLRRNLGL